MSRNVTNDEILHALLQIGTGLHQEFTEFRNSLKLAAMALNERKIDEAKHLARELEELSKHILNTKREIALISVPSGRGNLQAANFELDAVIKQTEDATNHIMTAAENIDAKASSLYTIEDREERASVIEAINNEVIAIYESCNFQDITGQRIRKIVRMLTYIETRINNMIQIWGDCEINKISKDIDEDEHPPADLENNLLNGPQHSETAVSQTEIDDFFR